jgi:hypothetical protein
LKRGFGSREGPIEQKVNDTVRNALTLNACACLDFLLGPLPGQLPYDEQTKTLGLNLDLQKRAFELDASNAKLDTFFYSVSHDLRTLPAIARRATGGMGRLIDDILNYSRTGRLPMNVREFDMVS